MAKGRGRCCCCNSTCCWSPVSWRAVKRENRFDARASVYIYTYYYDSNDVYYTAIRIDRLQFSGTKRVSTSYESVYVRLSSFSFFISCQLIFFAFSIVFSNTSFFYHFSPTDVYSRCYHEFFNYFFLYTFYIMEKI